MKNKTWGLVDSFFDKYDIVDHHIKSYNDFVENRIQKIIDITEPITIENEKEIIPSEPVRSKLKNLSPKRLTVLKV